MGCAWGVNRFKARRVVGGDVEGALWGDFGADAGGGRFVEHFALIFVEFGDERWVAQVCSLEIISVRRMAGQGVPQH